MNVSDKVHQRKLDASASTKVEVEKKCSNTITIAKKLDAQIFELRENIEKIIQSCNRKSNYLGFDIYKFI